MEEAGLPPGVIQFVPGDAEEITSVVLGHAQFAGLHFTGSTHVLKQLWCAIGQNIDKYVSFPRIVGETGGKNFHLVHPDCGSIDNVVHQTLRAAFEYQGQKCSACSRLYCPQSLWPEVKRKLVDGAKAIKLGTLETCLTTFVGPVIHARSIDKICHYLDHAKQNPQECSILAGGNVDTSVGFFVEPTIIECSDPHALTMREEIFGPVLSVYVYDDGDFERVAKDLVCGGQYALTGALFARDRHVIHETSQWLRDSCGNFYVNDKCTGAVVGQQPFGGSRASGTNDKAGSLMHMLRWTSARCIKENFLPLTDSFLYPSNQTSSQ